MLWVGPHFGGAPGRVPLDEYSTAKPGFQPVLLAAQAASRRFFSAAAAEASGFDGVYG